MTTGAAALAEADFTHWQVEVIVYHRKVGRIDSEFSHQLGHRFAAEVHISLWAR